MPWKRTYFVVLCLQLTLCHSHQIFWNIFHISRFKTLKFLSFHSNCLFHSYLVIVAAGCPYNHIRLLFRRGLHRLPLCCLARNQKQALRPPPLHLLWEQRGANGRWEPMSRAGRPPRPLGRWTRRRRRGRPRAGSPEGPRTPTSQGLQAPTLTRLKSAERVGGSEQK